MECIICDEKRAFVLECSHQVCLQCLVKMYPDSTKCPQCQVEINFATILTLTPCARCGVIQSDYCAKCLNFLCSSCWDLTHSFKPANTHRKEKLILNESLVGLRKNLLDKVNQLNTDLKQLETDLASLRDDPHFKGPSAKRTIIHKVRDTFDNYRRKVNEQQELIEAFIETATETQITDLLKQKGILKDTIHQYKDHLFEHTNTDLNLETSKDICYLSNLDYGLIFHDPIIPPIISLSSQNTNHSDSSNPSDSSNLSDSTNTTNPSDSTNSKNLSDIAVLSEKKEEKEEMVVDEEGTKYYVDGILHRDDDLPAVIHANGKQVWMKRGKIHRDHDLPAIILPNQTKLYYLEDILVKIVYPDNSVHQFVNGRIV